MIAKKRGRKPKNSIQNIPTNNINNKLEENLIIRIKLNSNDLNNNILPGYSQDLDYEKTINKDDLVCWNCCHKIDNNSKSIPLAYLNNCYYIYGSFCSNGCCLRYLSENFIGNELWSKYELFQLYCREIYNKNIELKIPPSKYTLKRFGGNLSIDEYKDINKEYKEINIPIIIPVKTNYQNKNVVNFKDTGDLKLFRRSKKEKTITNNMISKQ
jgi:hypothetical protein